jgi:hypothetical protein
MPATRAATVVGAIALAAATLFAALLPLGRMPANATAGRTELAGSGAAYASGLGSAAVPLLTGARASLDVSPRTGVPFAAARTEDGVVYVWPELARTLEAGDARIHEYDATSWLAPLLVALAAVFLALWTLSGADLARRGGPSLRERLEGPLVFAVSGALLVAILAAVARTEVTVSPGGGTQLWGKEVAFLVPTAVVLLALPLLGAVAVLAAGGATRRRATAPPPPPPSSGTVCARCAAAVKPGAAFCGSCGAPLAQKEPAP